ncbi:MAG: alanine racemase [Gammaproteobacteria bacterium]|nr:alanine racemase [Gammaproteobacteria bacterium]
MSATATAMQQANTPSLWLDRDRVEANIRRMHEHLLGLGVRLRPHLKTCKSMPVAQMMQAAGASCFTVSTLAEARYFHAQGLHDLLYAVGIAPGKLEPCAALMRSGCRLTITLDNLTAASAVAAAARQHAVSYRVLLEIDCDGERAGFAPDTKTLIQAARILDQAGCEVAGVMTHAGGSYHCRDRDCLRRAADNERDTTVLAAQRLRAHGFAAPVVSIGSTPTASFAGDLTGVTEVRPGTYVFQDLVMVGLGVCTADDIAISVLCEVIGHRAEHGELIVDAGWMALSRDPGNSDQDGQCGFGLVCDLAGGLLDGLQVRHVNQEHGVIADHAGRAIDLSAFPVGTRLRILPNHACATAAQYAGYHVMAADQDQNLYWERCSGW